MFRVFDFSYRHGRLVTINSIREIQQSNNRNKPFHRGIKYQTAHLWLFSKEQRSEETHEEIQSEPSYYTRIKHRSWRNKKKKTYVLKYKKKTSNESSRIYCIYYNKKQRWSKIKQASENIICCIGKMMHPCIISNHLILAFNLLNFVVFLF